MAEETKMITISMESIESDVMKQVSVIAKRQKDKAGDSLFGNTTLSAVEKVVIRQYIESAVRSFAGELAPVVKTYIDSSLPASVTFNVIRLNEGHKNAFESCFRGYVRAYTTKRKSPNAVAVLSDNASNGTKLVAATIDAPVENKP